MRDEMSSRLTPNTYLDSVVRVAVLAILAFACFRVFNPFAAIMTWALMLAIMFYPLHQRWSARLGGRQGLTATLMVIAVVLVIGPPMVMMGGSIAGDVRDFRDSYESGSLKIEPPDASVENWPIIGERLYREWRMAADNLPEFMGTHVSQVKAALLYLLSTAREAVGAVLFFVGAFCIAGLMMAFGRQGSAAMDRIFRRLAGEEQGSQILRLVVATVRSVATGVLGIAFIQALLFGIGFVLAGIPAGALLALVVLFLGILQLPAIIVGIPAIIYLWTISDASVGVNVALTIYFVIAGLADNFLKPLLLGRGVEAPMPVILIGAIGGMITNGLVGLFLGAAVLAVGYEIFMKWTHDHDAQSASGE